MRPTSPRLVLALLVVAYTFNFVDRTIISILGEAIKRDLQISDTQLGLLGGLFFALLYTCLGLPIARVAERVSRVNVIAASIATWSGFTVLCGAATGFASLALCRIGVGIGEAGLTPPGHSLITDYVPPHRRATALAVYVLGVPLGTMIGALAGGMIAQQLSWRAAFIIVGLPGLALAILFKLLVREPARGSLDSEGSAGHQNRAKQPLSLRGELRDIRLVITQALQRIAVRHILLGNILISFALAAGAIFTPSFLIRAFGYDFARVGLFVALIAGVGMGAGALAGGVLADWAARRRADGLALVPGLGALGGAAAYLLAFHQARGEVAIGLLMVGGLLCSAHLSTTYAILHANVAPDRRATASSVNLFVSNLAAMALGPLATGWLIDTIGEQLFASAGHGQGMVLGFAEACPGGVAAPGSTPAILEACATTLDQATRLSLSLVFVTMVWGGVHLLAGARAMRRDAACARSAPPQERQDR